MRLVRENKVLVVVAVFAAILFVGWLLNYAKDVCALTGFANKTGDADLGCFEFWLNRYQALLGAFVAVGAASAAWIAVQHQIELARGQVNVALGDIDPDIWLQREAMPMYHAVSRMTVNILNNNRRPLEVYGLELLAPARALMTVSYIENDQTISRLGNGPISRKHTFRRRIRGTRPAAPEVTRMELLLTLAIEGRPPIEGKNPRPEEVVVRLHYELLGPGGRRRQVELRCNGIFAD